MDRVYQGGPWSFDNQLLMLCKWKRGMCVRNVSSNMPLSGSKSGGHPLICYLRRWQLK